MCRRSCGVRADDDRLIIKIEEKVKYQATHNQRGDHRRCPVTKPCPGYRVYSCIFIYTDLVTMFNALCLQYVYQMHILVWNFKFLVNKNSMETYGI